MGWTGSRATRSLIRSHKNRLGGRGAGQRPGGVSGPGGVDGEPSDPLIRSHKKTPARTRRSPLSCSSRKAGACGWGERVAPLPVHPGHPVHHHRPAVRHYAARTCCNHIGSAFSSFPGACACVVCAAAAAAVVDGGSASDGSSFSCCGCPASPLPPLPSPLPPPSPFEKGLGRALRALGGAFVVAFPPLEFPPHGAAPNVNRLPAASSMYVYIYI